MFKVKVPTSSNQFYCAMKCAYLPANGKAFANTSSILSHLLNDFCIFFRYILKIFRQIFKVCVIGFSELCGKPRR